MTDSRVVISMTDVSSAFSPYRMFNLVSLYGKVGRIRVDKKRKTAQVEMLTQSDAERVVTALDRVPAFLRHIRCSLSDHRSWQHADENDDSVSTRDFSRSPLNRNTNGRMSEQPSRRVFFFDIPPGVVGDVPDGVCKLIRRRGCPEEELPCPRNIMVCSRICGEVEFENMQVAVEAIAMCNNVDIRGKEADPTQMPSGLFRLRFSDRTGR